MRFCKDCIQVNLWSISFSFDPDEVDRRRRLPSPMVKGEGVSFSFLYGCIFSQPWGTRGLLRCWVDSIGVAERQDIFLARFLKDWHLRFFGA